MTAPYMPPELSGRLAFCLVAISTGNGLRSRVHEVFRPGRARDPELDDLCYHGVKIDAARAGE